MKHTSITIKEMGIALEEEFGDRAMAFDVLLGLASTLNEVENKEAQWETLEQCENNYCRPVLKYISCEDFGKIDGMDGSCHFCKEMTPYQWHMCSDSSRIAQLSKKPPFGRGYPTARAIEFVQVCKSNS